MIPFKSLKGTELIFTHINTTTGAAEHYHPEAAYTAIAKSLNTRGKLPAWCQSISIPVEKEFAEYCISNRGIEQHRLDRLMTVTDYTPGLFVQMPDDSGLLIDGTHRYVAAYKRGDLMFKGFFILHPARKRFMISGFPVEDPAKLENICRSFSGIL